MKTSKFSYGSFSISPDSSTANVRKEELPVLLFPVVRGRVGENDEELLLLHDDGFCSLKGLIEFEIIEHLVLVYTSEG
jgi:hypothetical protein